MLVVHEPCVVCDVTLGCDHVYVTGKLCNQAFHEMPKNSRLFAKYLKVVGILCNGWISAPGI